MPRPTRYREVVLTSWDRGLSGAWRLIRTDSRPWRCLVFHRTRTERVTSKRMEEVIIRECTTIDELDRCVSLQREVFGLPDIEISPRRHLIVSRQAGGWTLGAFVADKLVGFVHHLAAVRNHNEIFGYSHMMAVEKSYQNKGVGARLKWAQRDRALYEGRKFIKWKWDQ